MRKIINFAIIAIFAISATFYACQKDEAIKSTDANNNLRNPTYKNGIVDNNLVSVIDNRLVFENRKDHETKNHIANHIFICFFNAH